MEKFQTVIFLIRHGKTDLPFSHKLSVDGDRQLTKQGRVEIEKVGEYLRSFAPSIIYSSPLLRAKQTAEIIKTAAEIPGSIIEESGLREMYHGKGEYTDRANNIHQFLSLVLRRHVGEQVVMVSHQDPLEAWLAATGFNKDELNPPCLMGQGYRVVFAGEIPVECQKIDPAGIK